MYHFISGYTAKIAGTEEGVTEPEATFSACFGQPFLSKILLHMTFSNDITDSLVHDNSMASCQVRNYVGGEDGAARYQCLARQHCNYFTIFRVSRMHTRVRH